MTIADIDRLAAAAAMSGSLARASALARLDQRMRRRFSFAAAVSARVDFFVTAVLFGEARSLNALADHHAPRSQLSDRSLDRVFEDADISDAVTAQLVALADTCERFARALRDAGYETPLAQWRARRSPGLFA